MWPFKRSRERDTVHGQGLAEARLAREHAERRLAHTQETLIVPLLEMHRENHIAPLINSLIQRRAAQRRDEP